MKIRLLAILIPAAMLMPGCGSHSHGDESHGHDVEAAEHEHEHDADVIELSAAKAQAAGVVADTVVKGEFHGVIRVSGKILEATGNETMVVATTSGVVKLAYNLASGLKVDPGATVATVSSANLQDGDATQKAYINYESARKEFERAQALLSDRLISEKDFVAVKAAYETAKVAYDAIGKNRGSGGVAVKVSSGGYVKDVFVADGAYVEVGQAIMTITQNREMYLRVDVPQRYYAELPTIRSAKFKMGYSPEVYDIEKLGGRMLAYGRTAGASGAYIPVTFVFNAAGGVLPGGFAEASLICGGRSDVISLPVGALTEEQGITFVYVKEDDDCYRKQEVVTGVSDGERVEIVGGLSGGECVVTSGAIHVKIASASNSIPAHTHNH